MLKKKRNRKNDNKFLIFIGVLIIVLVAVISFLLGVSSNKNNNHSVENQQDNQESNNSTELQEKMEKGFEISTSYISLFYPEKWKQQIRTEVIEEDVLKIEFYGTVEGKEEIHLFDILFGGEEGYAIGTIIKDNEEIDVNVVSYDFEKNNEWTDDEYNELCAMQEDVNFVIQKLKEHKEFKEDL